MFCVLETTQWKNLQIAFVLINCHGNTTGDWWQQLAVPFITPSMLFVIVNLSLSAL